ncbi:MAG: type II secretion system protein [Fimbriimonadaceae bacterium]|nr:type II secretion system protein [Fimbriimonadaceae bacterium]
MIKRRTNAFTLLELIVVMAISAILLTIIAIPLVQGFNLTRAAQGFADAQDKARQVISQIEIEVGNAAGVRSNTGDAGALNLPVPGQNGATELVRLEAVKMDLYKIAEGDPSNFQLGPGGRRGFVNPDTGLVDPTLQGPKGDPNFPAAAGTTIVRYFIGLRDPFQPYNNPYDRLLARNATGRDNLFVLYRAEVRPYIYDTATNRYVVNANLFFDQDSDNDPNTRGALLDDLNFFIDDGNMGGTYAATPPGWGEPGIVPSGPPSKAGMIANWVRAAKIVTEVSRYDMIVPVFDRRTRNVSYLGNVPQLIPLIRFQPTRVSAEPAQGRLAVRTGEETFNADKVGADVFVTAYGAWSELTMRSYPTVYPSSWGFNPGDSLAGTPRASWITNPLGTSAPYILGRTRPDGGFSLYWFNPAVMSDEKTEGVEVFDVSLYQYASAGNLAFPFTQAIVAADNRSGFSANAAAVRDFMAMVPNPQAGRVTASFDIREVGALGGPVPPGDNSPAWATGPAETPDSNSAPAEDFFAGRINQRFNRMWNDWATLAPGIAREQYAKRFVDLRFATGPTGERSPLDPRTGLGRAYITPGSEIVIGPDQRPGANYGLPVRYTRVVTRPVGPNQYFINYVDQRDPDWVAAGVLTAAQANALDIYNPQSFQNTDFTWTVLATQFRAGYLELNSNKNEPIPDGNISVAYRFQFTEPNDVVTADYDSSEVMEIILTIRNFPQTSNPEPQAITVKGSADVRNFIR